MDNIIKNIKERIEKLKDSNNRTKIILAVGLIALVLIALSEIIPTAKPAKKDIPKALLTEVIDAESYARSLEERLEEIVSNIKGAGRCKVMVTLRSGTEYIYASEEKNSSDTTQQSGSGGQQSSGVKQNSQSSLIVIRGADGEEALKRTELMPRVGGVVVLCEGAGNPETEQRILSAVTTVLGISSKRVCITLLKGGVD